MNYWPWLAGVLAVLFLGYGFFADRQRAKRGTGLSSSFAGPTSRWTAATVPDRGAKRMTVQHE